MRKSKFLMNASIGLMLIEMLPIMILRTGLKMSLAHRLVLSNVFLTSVNNSETLTVHVQEAKQQKLIYNYFGMQQ
jgi:hypothetical protein